MYMDNLARIISHPELQITEVKHASGNTITMTFIKTSDFEVCPKCASKADRIYDHGIVTIKDEPRFSQEASE